MQSPLPQNQPLQCSVCNLPAAPQSTQHILFLILQIALLFVNWKFSLILLMFGYSFPRVVWKCPFCSREVQMLTKDHNLDNSIILKMGNCIAMFSVGKFRVVAGAIILFMFYLFYSQPKYKPMTPVVKTWESLVDNCGYEAYMENSVRANHFYGMYLDSGLDWQIKGIFLTRQPTGISTNQYIYIKMNPTQFKDPDAYDFKVFTKVANNLQLAKGDIITLQGQWQGRFYQTMIFNSIEIINTGMRKQPKDVQYFYRTKSMLRSHFDAVKGEYKELEVKANDVGTGSDRIKDKDLKTIQAQIINQQKTGHKSDSPKNQSKQLTRQERQNVKKQST